MVDAATTPTPSHTPPTGQPSLFPPPPIDPRAPLFATQIVESHYESVTGSHMHWLYRELSKLMHKEFSLSAKEEASLKVGQHGHTGSTRRNKRRYSDNVTAPTDF